MNNQKDLLRTKNMIYNPIDCCGQMEPQNEAHYAKDHFAPKERVNGRRYGFGTRHFRMMAKRDTNKKMPQPAYL